MNIKEEFLAIGEYMAAGLYEEPHRSLFYRKALGIRRFFENVYLPKYEGKPLYPSGGLFFPNIINPYYYKGIGGDRYSVENDFKNIGRPELGEKIIEDFFRYSPSLPGEHTVAGCMYIHSMPNYERILGEGLGSYADRIKKIEDADMCEGLLHLVSGIECYAQRCAEYLESVNADKKLINALKKVPMMPAENIYEAIVCWNFVLYLDNCDNLGCVASGLMPYYNGEDITPLLRNLYENLDTCGGYSMALGTDYSPLTVQCLKAAHGMRRPMIELFVDETTPDEVWQAAFELLRSGGGQPAFYSPKELTLLKKRFPEIQDADIKKFCGGGCTEAMLAGLSNVGSLDAGINLALILENTIHSRLEACSSFEEFYDILISEIQKVVDKVTTEISVSQKNRSEYEPLPMRTLLIDDCIDKSLDYNNGGARYMWSIINFAGLINVIDSLLVIRDYVFTNKLYSASELVSLLKNNDEGFLNKAKRHSVSFGNGNPDADGMAKRVSTDIYSMLDKPMPYMGSGFLPASIQFITPADAGKNIGATPDGRSASSPLCDSLGAILGKDTNGPTELLKSVTKLNLERALGIPVLNFMINPEFPDGIFKSLILSYMEMGGIQMQINCVSKELLQKAYHDPDGYPNLVVRVGGFSEYFCRLSDDLKKSIIERTVQM